MAILHQTSFGTDPELATDYDGSTRGGTAAAGSGISKSPSKSGISKSKTRTRGVIAAGATVGEEDESIEPRRNKSKSKQSASKIEF